MSRQLLGGWTPRDTAHQLQRVTRHSVIVAVSKYGLFVLAAVLMCLVFIIPALHQSDDGERLVFSNIKVGESLKPRMLSPRLQGMDEKQQPYKLNAEYADRLNDGTVFLHKIDAEMSLNSGAWLALMADEGIYNSEAKTLIIPKEVNIFHDEGYEIRTRNVHMDLVASEASSKERIEIQGSFGNLKASGFIMNTATKRILFPSQVSVRLYPQK